MDRDDATRARPVGRAVRLLAGVALVALGGLPLTDAGGALMLQVAGVVAAAFLFYLVAHLLIDRLFPRVNPWLGAILAVVPIAAVFVWGGTPGQLGAILFIGVSLLFAAARAEGGCEVMTLPGILFGERTHLVCIAFSPIDWLEDRLAHRRADTLRRGG